MEHGPTTIYTVHPAVHPLIGAAHEPGNHNYSCTANGFLPLFNAINNASDCKRLQTKIHISVVKKL
jgi:hypothetical protein